MKGVERAKPKGPTKKEQPAYLIASGGYQHHTTIDIFAFMIKGDKTLYKAKMNKWTRKGGMHVARSNHASCTLDTRAYFFGGLDSNHNRLSSIEWFDLESGDRCNAPCDPPAGMKDRFARELPCFAPLSQTEIAIMGGLGDSGKLSDVLLANTGTLGNFEVLVEDTQLKSFALHVTECECLGSIKV